MADRLAARGGEDLRAFAILAAMWVRVSWTYRTSFLVMTAASLVITGIDFVVILVMFSNVDQLGGFGLGQIAFLYGATALCLGIGDLVVGNVERDVTLLLTTHDLQDIEQLCSRVMVIDHGSLVYDGTLGGLHDEGSSSRTLVVDLVDEAPPIGVPGARVAKVEGPRQWLTFPAGASAAPVVAAVAASYDVADLSIQLSLIHI